MDEKIPEPRNDEVRQAEDALKLAHVDPDIIAKVRQQLRMASGVATAVEGPGRPALRISPAVDFVKKARGAARGHAHQLGVSDEATLVLIGDFGDALARELDAEFRATVDQKGVTDRVSGDDAVSSVG